MADGNARVFIVVACSCLFNRGKPVSAGFGFDNDACGSKSEHLLFSDTNTVGFNTPPCFGVAVEFAESFV